MKKAVIALPVILLAFLCFLFGLFLGRYTSTGNNMLSHQSQVHTEPSVFDSPVDPETCYGKININTASFALLQTLPGIGETLAQRIIDFREEYGAFSSIEDLTLVNGIGEKTLEQIRDYITVGG